MNEAVHHPGTRRSERRLAGRKNAERSIAGALAVGALAVVLALSPAARAQIPDEFTNLKLLDEEITKPELIAVMRSWTLSLGVRCNHCHVGPDNLQGADFASDEKPTKRTARRMFEMIRTINGDHLASLPVHESGAEEQPAREAQSISCYTCHRGQELPPRDLVDLLAEKVRASGPGAAINEYRRLRDEHRDAGRYDFREESLSRLARGFAETGDFESALAILDGAKEFFGDSPSLYFSEGMTRFSQKDLDGARASFEEALARDAEFVPAKRALGQLEAMIEKAPVQEGAAEKEPR